MCLILEKLFYSKLLYKKLHWVARAKTTIIIIISLKTINISIINLIGISNLTKLVISINSKRKIDQIIILIRKRATSARMQKWRMKKIIIILNIINRDIIIEIVQKKWNKTTIIRMIIIDSKNNEALQTFQWRSKKKSIKIKNSILIKKWVQFRNEKDLLTTFIDSKTKINFVNQIYMIQ